MKMLALFLFFACVLLSCPAMAQVNPDEVIRVDTSLVVVPVRVVDKNGRFVPDLRKENFRIFENNVEQEIVSFDPDDSPFTVALMLDASESTKFKLTEIQEAAIAFLSQLRPKDRAVVFVFHSGLVKIYEGGTENREIIEKSFRVMRTGGSTALYDAVSAVALRYLRKSDRKKAIVLFTDGIDTSSQETYLGSLKAAQESYALIYSIQYPTVEDQRKSANYSAGGLPVNILTSKGEPILVAYQRGTSYLGFLARNSGGRYYLADTVKNLTEIFRNIAAELSQQYVLSYYPQNQTADGRQRNVKVKINVPDAKSITRKIYVAGPRSN